MLPPQGEQGQKNLLGVSEIGALLAELPGVADRLLADHTADTFGHCRACALPQTARVRWPCTLVVYAREARRLQQASRIPRRKR